MNVSFPHYGMVPKDLKANLRYRQKVLRDAAQDPDHQSALIAMCAEDCLFYVNTFCWTRDPRRRPSSIPFITYGFQDAAFETYLQALLVEDVHTEKSRDMGASWCLLTVFEWAWHFIDGLDFLLLSRNEDYVDKPDNPKALFFKIDFLHDPKHMPRWLMPAIKRNKLNIKNENNGSVISGESTTGDAGRGDRRSAVLLDEFAAFDVSDGYRALSATRDVTPSRFFNSTPQGANNAFYDMSKKPLRKVRMHWSEHPRKNPGLYIAEDDGTGVPKLKILDADFVFTEGYEFILDGKLRSPWYDNERERCASDQEAGQELDIDYLGSGHQFFDPVQLTRIDKEHCRPPYMQGEIEYDADSLEPTGFTPNAEGRFKLWMNLGIDNAPPKDREYSLGGDVSTGTGNTNSSLSGADRLTGEKIFEFADPHIDPARFGELAVVVARWLNDAFLLWEANGPGRIFGNRVIEAGYRHLYYRTNEQTLSKKVTDTPGWWATPDNKRALLGEYRRAIGQDLFLNHSALAVEECRHYIYTSSGAIEHSNTLKTNDPTNARANHGDRVIADALAWKGAQDRPTDDEPEEESEAREGSLAWRREQRQKEERDKDEWED